MGASPVTLDRRGFLKIVGVMAAGGAAGAVVAREALGQTGRAGNDPIEDLAFELDHDPERIFQYVSERVVYDAYEGALRGPAEALASGAANSVDQALLMAALLRAAAVPVRFAVGHVEPDVMARITGSRPTTVEAERERVAGILLPAELAAGWTGPGGWARPAEGDALLEQAAERVAATVDLLTTALAGAGVAIPSVRPPDDTGERDAHAWVQYQRGADWIDLDPTVPGAAPGTAHGSPAATLETIPDERYQTVTVRLVGEIVTGGVPTRTELLSHTVRVADVSGTPVIILHASPAWLGVAGALTGEQRFEPTLLMGDTVVTGTMITLSRGGGFDEVIDGATDAEGQIIAESLEIDVAVPGVPPTTSSRVLFDRVPSERRASGDIDLASLPPIELTDLGGQLGRVYRPLAGVLLVSIVGAAIPASAFTEAARPTEDDLLHDGALAYHHLRDLLALDLADTMGMTSWRHEPVVSVLRTIAGGSDAPAQLVLDLHASRHRMSVFDDAAPLGPSGIVAGAIDHATERMMAAGAALLLAPAEPPSETSVGRILEVATETGIPIRVLAPDHPVDIDGLSAATLGHIAAAQAWGRYLVIPERQVPMGGSQRIGWWEFDPVAGVALDRMDDGGRADALEYIAIRSFMAGLVCGSAYAMGVILVEQFMRGRTLDPSLVAGVTGGFASCALAL